MKTTYEELYSSIVKLMSRNSADVLYSMVILILTWIMSNILFSVFLFSLIASQLEPKSGKWGFFAFISFIVIYVLNYLYFLKHRASRNNLNIENSKLPFRAIYWLVFSFILFICSGLSYSLLQNR